MFDNGTTPAAAREAVSPASATAKRRHRRLRRPPQHPGSRRLTARLVELLHDWNHTRPARPIITVYRAGTPDDQLGPDTRLTITW
ncbi:hypothetical protein [Streptosporangium sp. NPDC001681]|uniref:hypothetical protein n=1 Tax=Streptosporangium sp. NPDC001681 TaxID=3154395 RepID=UPI00332278FA